MYLLVAEEDGKVMHSGIHLEHLEEMFDEKNYERPFGLKTEDIMNGVKVSREEVNRMYDWNEKRIGEIFHRSGNGRREYV